MTWGYVAVAGATLVSGYLGSQSSKDAAGKARSAEQAALDEQRRQADQSRQDMLPWLNAGTAALDRLNLASTGDSSAFFNSPDYKFTLDQGMKAVNRGQVGNLFGGGTSADLLRLGQGLATQNYGDWWNRQAGLAQVGQAQSQSLGGLGQNFGNAYAQGMGNIGNINQSAVANQGNIWGNTVGQLGGLFGQYMGQRQQPQAAVNYAPAGSVWGQQATSGQGSMSNFGNNLDNFAAWGR